MTPPRRARKADLASLNAVLDTAGDRPPLATFLVASRIDEGRAWVIEHEGKPAGLLLLAPGPTGVMIEALVVAPQVRRRGLGRALVHHAEAEAQRLGQRRLWAFVDADAPAGAAFLMSQGFVETRRSETEGRTRSYVAKSIAAPPRPRRRLPHDRPRASLLHRWAIASLGPDGAAPSRASVVVLGFFGTLLAGIASLMVQFAIEDWRMASAWLPAQAQVVAVLRERGPSRGPNHAFSLQLEAATPDGRRITGVTVREHPVAPSLEHPVPRVHVGQELAILMDPSDPRRMVTPQSFRGAAPLVAAVVYGAPGVFFLLAAAARVRARRIVARCKRRD
jgi:ribosomal protein S18 acetylase RimI-like enzyme